MTERRVNGHPAARGHSLSEILQDQLGRDRDVSLENVPENVIRKALLQRPRFTVRARIIIISVTLYLIATATAATAWFILSNIQYRSNYVAITDVFTHEIQEARRYEKNYFLYGSELTLVLQHLENADQLLRQAADEIWPSVAVEEIQALQQYFAEYRQLIKSLIDRQQDLPFRETQEFKNIETSLRDRGSKMASLAFDISTRERREISSLIALTKTISLCMFIVLLPIAAYFAVHISRHITSRLARLMETTQRIAESDFSPILPKRKYKDEFSNLAIALNHMMYELEKRQKILVESHKMRAVGNLTAAIAHELNNPLNNIMLTSEMLKEDFNRLGDEERLEMVGDIISQAERTRSIVKNLLDFARKSETRMEHLFLHNLLEETLALAGNQIKLNKIKLDVDLDPNLPPVFGDRGLLQQVLLNLILNAIDAMPDGGHLFIRSRREPDTPFIAIHITDTGSGIPNHLLPSIFDPFFTTKPTGRGTGLGLSVSRGIVNNHGGDIDVMSKVGVGSTFTVRLPSVPVPAELDRKERDVNRDKRAPSEEDRTAHSH